MTKTWSPNRLSYAPGAASAIALGVSNASNVNVDKLVIQEPKTAVDGASTLDASNPFTITDFTGLQNVSLPASCTSVQVDAYVFQGRYLGVEDGPARRHPDPAERRHECAGRRHPPHLRRHHRAR